MQVAVQKDEGSGYGPQYGIIGDRQDNPFKEAAWVSLGQELTIDMSDEVLGRFRKKIFWTLFI